MTFQTTPQLAIVEESIPNARQRRRNMKTIRVRGVRAGFWVYAGLAVVTISAVFRSSTSRACMTRTGTAGPISSG